MNQKIPRGACSTLQRHIASSLVTLTAILGYDRGALFAGVNSPDAFANFLSADAIN
jgi:hypothetical protein